MQALIYGFGSFFKNHSHNDIDILILHESTNNESCIFAISCKESLRLNINNTHITVLSISEEKQFNFLKTTGAFFLGSVTEIRFNSDIEKIISTLHSYNNNNIH